ncbi:MAG: putative membrane protein [Rhodanobacteraceae bacterium]|jgi:hypothetical protein|nr:MAG: putative membrane protein [Rhodanobacteraceae bacterium]
MNIDRLVMRFAGGMVVLSVVLAYYFTPWWLLLALFVGLNLFQASFTGFCPLARILGKLGVQPGSAFPK